LQEKSTITADKGVYHDQEKLIELHKNVVGTNAKGDTFSSDELIWDQSTKQIHSNQAVHVRLADGSITDGTSFVSDENFNHWTMEQGKGIIHVNSQEIGQ